MKAAEGVKLLEDVQRAFTVIAMLQIDVYMWPRQATVQNGDAFDFIVLGGGTAGCVVAARLVEDMKTRVLLVEAGCNPTLETNIPGMLIYMNKGSVDWGFTSTNDGYSCQCQTTGKLDLFLGKMLGGTSSVNFLLFSGGTRRDYNSWARISNDTSWCWGKLKPYFSKAFKNEQQLLKVSNNCSVQDSSNTKSKISLMKDPKNDYDAVYLNGFKEAGNKLVTTLDAKTTVGYTKTMYNIGDGVRQSTAFTYLRPVKEYPNLYVLTNTVATKILFDKHKTATGVEIVLESGNLITVKATKEVIVSSGTINSPKLLMLSGVGPAKHLKSKGIEVIADLPVGKNLQDHVSVTIIHNMTKINIPVGTRDSRMYPANAISGCSSLDKKKYYPEACSINFVNYASYLIQFCSVTYGLNEQICNALFGYPNYNQMLYTMINLTRPKSRGSVELQSKNYKDPPIVRTGFYSDSSDLDKMVSYIEQFSRVTTTSSFKSAGAEFVNPKLSKCASYKFRSKEYWRCYALCMMTSRRHYAGTNAIGSVVDSRLRVLGVKKLRVVDASVMPVLTTTETFGPTVIIAEKAVDMIKTDNNI